ncbi:MAG: hypothetical protein P8Y70_20435, partial [Candidatus Lokiarchaeota archaeon]
MLSRRISTTDHRYYLSNLLRNSQHPSNIILLRWRVFLESKRFLNPSIIDAALSHLSELKRSLNYDTLKYIGNLFHEITEIITVNFASKYYPEIFIKKEFLLHYPMSSHKIDIFVKFNNFFCNNLRDIF